MSKIYKKSPMRFLVCMAACTALLPGLVGCATIVKSDDQVVEIISNQDGIRLSTQNYQDYELQTGMNKLYLRRSVDDIPIFIRCSTGSGSHMAYLSTYPSGWYVFGNIFSWGISGWLIDYITEKGWNIQKSIVASHYC